LTAPNRGSLEAPGSRHGSGAAALLDYTETPVVYQVSDWPYRLATAIDYCAMIVQQQQN
jgi:hypothetical protein